MSNRAEITFVQPRPTVEVHLPDGKVLCGPRNATVGEFLLPLQPVDGIHDNAHPPIVGAIINWELRELTYPIKMDSFVQPVTMGTPDGMRIYRRSLTFLLEAAFSELFREAVLTVDHSVTPGVITARLASAAR